MFVENKLIDNSSDVEFQYVSTKDNPADVASRGTTVFSPIKNKRFWNGPSWLTKNRSEWPT